MGRAGPSPGESAPIFVWPPVVRDAHQGAGHDRGAGGHGGGNHPWWRQWIRGCQYKWGRGGDEGERSGNSSTNGWRWACAAAAATRGTAVGGAAPHEKQVWRPRAAPNSGSCKRKHQHPTSRSATDRRVQAGGCQRQPNPQPPTQSARQPPPHHRQPLPTRRRNRLRQRGRPAYRPSASAQPAQRSPAAKRQPATNSSPPTAPPPPNGAAADGPAPPPVAGQGDGGACRQPYHRTAATRWRPWAVAVPSSARRSGIAACAAATIRERGASRRPLTAPPPRPPERHGSGVGLCWRQSRPRHRIRQYPA